MYNDESLIVTEKPELRHPYIVCGMGGWVNGGEAATGSVKYLVSQLQARKFARIPIDNFHVFQIPGEIGLRPKVKLEDGVLKDYKIPKNQFYFWKNPNSENDLILFRASEPNIQWGTYVDAILRLAAEYATPRIYLLGGVLDETPHSKEPRVSCACTNEEVKQEISQYNVEFSNYEGPGSFATTMLHFCQQRGPQAVSMTVRATYYADFNIIIPHNPKAIRAMLRRLNHMLQLSLDFSELDKEVKEFEGKLDFMAGQNPRFRAHIEELEKRYVEMSYQEPLGISGDEAVRLAEEFLKNQHHNL